MKRINKPAVLPKDLLKDVVDSKKGSNKTRLQGLQSQLDGLYDDYINKASLGNLHALTPQWVYDMAQHDSEGYFLYHQYDNSKKSIAELHAKIIEANGGKMVLKCPICGLRETSEMDHYVPRQLFPEYSIHAYNLIPTCHQCNNDKGTMWCENGHRLIFNAYYDNPTDEVLYDVSVRVDNGVLSISLSLKKFVNPKKETRLALTTISKLKLMRYINYKVSEKFSTKIEEIVRRCKHFPGSFDDFWDMECGALKDKIASVNDVNDYERIVCEVIRDAPLVKTWLIVNTNSHISQ